IVVLAPLRVTSVEPGGALPGDEVVLSGNGFVEGLTLTVSGQPATVVKAEAQSVRFQMPKLEGPPGSQHAVIATANGRSSAPVQIYLGRLPLIASIEPPRGVAGDLVHLKGAGFVAGTTVTFDAGPALVVAGTTSELLVVVPPSPHAQAEAPVPV